MKNVPQIYVTSIGHQTISFVFRVLIEETSSIRNYIRCVFSPWKNTDYFIGTFVSDIYLYLALQNTASYCSFQ